MDWTTGMDYWTTGLEYWIGRMRRRQMVAQLMGGAHSGGGASALRDLTCQ